jgi:hypothetical protein
MIEFTGNGHEPNTLVGSFRYAIGSEHSIISPEHFTIIGNYLGNSKTSLRTMIPKLGFMNTFGAPKIFHKVCMKVWLIPSVSYTGVILSKYTKYNDWGGGGCAAPTCFKSLAPVSHNLCWDRRLVAVEVVFNPPLFFSC